MFGSVRHRSQQVPLNGLRRPPQRHHRAVFRRCGAIAAPGVHEATPFLEQIAAPVGCFHLVADGMGERRFRRRCTIESGAADPVRFRAFGDQPSRADSQHTTVRARLSPPRRRPKPVAGA